MKKIVAILSCLLLTLSICAPIYAASVDPIRVEGNDSEYIPPVGYIRYQIPNSGQEGIHTARFDENGAVDSNGSYFFTVVIGTKEGEEYTQVLSWNSNFPVYAVIVKGGSAYNLYQYGAGVQADEDLVAPDNNSGDPADVSHVSIVYNPDFPPLPTPTPTPTMTPTMTPTTPCCPCPPNPPCNIIGIIIAFLILAFFFLGAIIGLMSVGCFMKCKKKKKCCKRENRRKEKPEKKQRENNKCSYDCHDECENGCQGNFLDKIKTINQNNHHEE